LRIISYFCAQINKKIKTDNEKIDSLDDVPRHYQQFGAIVVVQQ